MDNSRKMPFLVIIRGGAVCSYISREQVLPVWVGNMHFHIFFLCCHLSLLIWQCKHLFLMPVKYFEIKTWKIISLAAVTGKHRRLTDRKLAKMMRLLTIPLTLSRSPEVFLAFFFALDPTCVHAIHSLCFLSAVQWEATISPILEFNTVGVKGKFWVHMRRAVTTRPLHQKEARNYFCCQRLFGYSHQIPIPRFISTFLIDLQGNWVCYFYSFFKVGKRSVF